MNKLDIKFEFKSLGKVIFLPLLLVIGTIAYSFFMKTNYSANQIDSMISCLEFLFAPSISLWIVYLFYDYYENKSLEVLLSYPLKNRKHISDKVLLFTVFYALPLLIILLINFFSKNTFLVLFQIIPQIIFFAGFTTILITIFKNVNVALFIIIGYVSTEVLTDGSLIPWYHIFHFNNTPLSLEILLPSIILNLILGISMIFISNKLLRYN